MQQPNVLFIDLIYGSYRKTFHWSFLTILKHISALCAIEKKKANKFKEIKCRIAVTGPKASRSEQINCKRGLCVSLHGKNWENSSMLKK